MYTLHAACIRSYGMQADRNARCITLAVCHAIEKDGRRRLALCKKVYDCKYAVNVHVNSQRIFVFFSARIFFFQAQPITGSCVFLS